MFIARIFKTGEIITAQDVFDGKYDRHEDFVDVEEDFKVLYWKGAKNHGRPHFKLYLSLEDYKKLSDEQKSRFDILREQRHFQESLWHKEWENKFDSFAEIEKTIKNPNTNRRKRADAYYEKINTCIEFQHSFIDYDFEERNEFYKELGINTIWLYDLTHLHVNEMDDGSYQILEDNAKGFFRIAENPENLKNNKIFIQTRGGLIYQVPALYRKPIDNDLKSTIRYFYPTCIITESEFIERIKNNGINKQITRINGIVCQSIHSLWKPEYYQMVVNNVEEGYSILVCEDRNKKGKMEKDFKFPSVIIYRYVTWKNNHFEIRNKTRYRLKSDTANKNVWSLIYGYSKK
ncbi:MAG: hypothetical protein IJI44_04000 [Erysipelotrichaceae bacterium]|nr:hypothetical protein [Erysipelotrichaceae bacterium]